MGSPKAGQLGLTTLFGKKVAADGFGKQFADTASPFSADQISSAIAQISRNGNSSTDQSRRFTEAPPSSGTIPETTTPGNEGPEATSFPRGGTSEASSPSNDIPSPQLPGSLSEASDKPELPDSCKQQ